MSNADDEVDVAHDLAEDARRHVRQLHRLQSGAAMKKDGVHGQTLNLQRRADTLVERQAGANADLGKGFPYVLLGDPAALRQESHGLAVLDLVASITARLSAVAFLLPGDHVKLAEDLLERLH